MLAPQPPLPALTPTGVIDRSSPIALLCENDQILTDFFHWKINKMNNRPDLQRKLENVHEVIQREMWSVEDIKDMSDENSNVHKRAIALNLPYGLIRSFKT